MVESNFKLDPSSSYRHFGSEPGARGDLLIEKKGCHVALGRSAYATWTMLVVGVGNEAPMQNG